MQGFLLDKKIGVNQPKVIENAKILIANTSMDADKIKVFGSRVRVDSTAKLAEIEHAEKEKMKDKVDKILAHGISCFINRQLIYNYPEQVHWYIMPCFFINSFLFSSLPMLVSCPLSMPTLKEVRTRPFGEYFLIVIDS